MLTAVIAFGFLFVCCGGLGGGGRSGGGAGSGNGNTLNNAPRASILRNTVTHETAPGTGRQMAVLRCTVRSFGTARVRAVYANIEGYDGSHLVYNASNYCIYANDTGLSSGDTGEGTGHYMPSNVSRVKTTIDIQLQKKVKI